MKKRNLNDRIRTLKQVRDVHHSQLDISVVTELNTVIAELEEADKKRWLRLFGQKSDCLKWSLADVGLSTAPLAAPCAGQERAARWVTRPGTYAAF